ncbi:MAG TPA: sigma-70 family RNA polymerase sigma factor [Acidimicrobiales bacterium]|nr:sigma-70 family RNA polymerase sigma factor [Acidimicrobiales bacterium]
MGNPRTSPSPLAEASDTVLVLAIGRWDEEALAEAFRRHAGAVYGVARRILRDEGAAREIAHDAFVRLWYEPDRYDPERGTLRTFLLNYAHSRAIDRLRSERRRAQREEEDARGRPTLVDDVEREVWDLALVSQVRDAVSELPEDERRAIEMAYFGGRTYRETAEILGEPEGTVKSRIRSGLRRLQDKLAAVGVVEAGS